MQVIWDNVLEKLFIKECMAVSQLLPVFKSKELALEAYENNKQIFETALKP